MIKKSNYKYMILILIITLFIGGCKNVEIKEYQATNAKVSMGIDGIPDDPKKWYVADEYPNGIEGISSTVKTNGKGFVESLYLNVTRTNLSTTANVTISDSIKSGSGFNTSAAIFINDSSEYHEVNLLNTVTIEPGETKEYTLFVTGLSHLRLIPEDLDEIEINYMRNIEYEDVNHDKNELIKLKKLEYEELEDNASIINLLNNIDSEDDEIDELLENMGFK